MATQSEVVEKRLRTTLELNTGNFNKDFKNVNALLKENQTEVRNTAKEVKAFGGSAQSLTASLAALTKQYELQNAKTQIYRDGIEKTNKAYTENIAKRKELAVALSASKQSYESMVVLHGQESEAAKQAADEVSKLQKEYDKTNKQLQANEKALKRYQTGLRNTETDIKVTGKAVETTTVALDKSNSAWLKSATAIDTYNKRIDKVKTSLNSISNASLMGGAVVGTAVAGSIKAWAEYGDTLAKVNTIANVSQQELEEMGAEIKQISNDFTIPINQLAEAEYQALSASVAVKDSTQFLQDAAKLAKGGFTDIESSVDILTSTMNAYGMATSEAARVSDVLMQTQNKGKTTIDQLSTQLGELIPTAKNASVDIENVGASIATVTMQGIGTNQSVTYLNSMFNELSKSSTKVSQTLKQETGKTFQDLMKEGNSVADVLGILKDHTDKTGTSFNDMFSSSEAMRAALALLKDEGNLYNKTLGEMENSAGATQKAFDMMSNTDLERARKSLNELLNSVIRIGSASAPILEEVSVYVSKLADTIENMDEETILAIANSAKWAIILGTVGKATVGVVSGVSTLAKGYSSLAKTIGAAGGLKSAIGGLTGNLTGLVKLANPVTLLFGALVVGIHEANKAVEEKLQKVNDALERSMELLETGITSQNKIEVELEMGDLDKQVETVEKLEEAIKKTREEQAKVKKEMAPIQDIVWNDATEATSEYQKQLSKLMDEEAKLTVELAEQQTQLGKVSQEIQEQTGTVDAAKKQIEAYRTAMEDYNRAEEMASIATTEHTKALAETYSEMIKGKTYANALAVEYRNLTSMEELSEEQTKRLDEVQKELTNTFGDSIIVRDREGKLIGVSIPLLEKEIQARYGVGDAAVEAAIKAGEVGVDKVNNLRDETEAVLKLLKTQQMAYLETQMISHDMSETPMAHVDFTKNLFSGDPTGGIDAEAAYKAHLEAEKLEAQIAENENLIDLLDEMLADLGDVEVGSSVDVSDASDRAEAERDYLQEALTVFEQKKALNKLSLDEEMKYLDNIRKAHADTTEDQIKMNDYMLDNYLSIIERRKAAGQLYYDEEVKMLENARDNYAVTESTKIEIDNQINEKKLANGYAWVEKKKYYNDLALEEEKAAYGRMLEYAKNNAEETEALQREIYRVQQEMLDKEVQAVEEATKKKIEARKKEKDDELDDIDKALEGELAKYQAELDALDELEAENARLQKEREHNEKIQGLESDLTNATTDAERNAIIAQMNAENNSYADYLAEQELQKEREAIEKKMELARQEAEAQKKTAEEAYDKEVELINSLSESYIGHLEGKEVDTQTAEKAITTFLSGEYDVRNSLFATMVDKDVAYLQSAAQMIRTLYGGMFGGASAQAMLQIPTSNTTNTTTINNSPVMHNTYNVASMSTAKAVTTNQNNMLSREARNLGIRK